MARKAARGRKNTKRRSIRPVSRPTRSHTTPARAAKAAALTGQQAAAARREVTSTVRDPKAREKGADQERPTRAEDDEELDWLSEDEDPRSQIVEDDEPDPGREEEW